MRAHLFVMCCFLFALSTSAATPGSEAKVSPPQLSFDASTVTITNVTPNATVALFSVARESRRYSVNVVTRRAVIADEDGDGKVTYTIDLPHVPRRSVWAAVDMSSGVLALAAPSGFPLQLADLPAHALKQTTPGKLKKLELPNSFMDVVLIRPGTGAWWITAFDGAEMDDDKVLDGKFSLPFEQLMPFEGSTTAAPDDVRNGDVLLIIDEETLGVLAMGGTK